MKIAILFVLALLLTTNLAPNLAQAEGAVAASRDGRVGLSYNYPGRRGAEERALEECGRGCRVIQTYHRNCAAVATGERGGYGYAIRDRLERAEREAIENCRNEGARGCRIATRGCDERG